MPREKNRSHIGQIVVLSVARSLLAVGRVVFVRRAKLVVMLFCRTRRRIFGGLCVLVGHKNLLPAGGEQLRAMVTPQKSVAGVNRRNLRLIVTAAV